MNRKEYLIEKNRRYAENRIAWDNYPIKMGFCLELDDLVKTTRLTINRAADSCRSEISIPGLDKDNYYLTLNDGYWKLVKGSELIHHNCNIWPDAVFEINLPKVPKRLVEKLPDMNFCGSCGEVITPEQAEEYSENYHYDCRP